MAKCLITKTRLDAETENLIPCQGGSFDYATYSVMTAQTGQNGSGISKEIAATLDRASPQAVCYPINSQIAMRHEALGEGTGMGIGAADDPSFTLLKNHSHAVAFAQNQVGEVRTGDVMGTLNTNTNASGRNTPMVACFKGGQGAKAGGLGYDENVSPTLSAADSGTNRTPALMQGMAVRRLTPVECERLQGFPDGYTDINAAGGGHTADGPRYKAMGNSMAVPVMSFLGKRIQMIEDIINAP